MKAERKACILAFLAGGICYLFTTGTIEFDVLEVFIKYIVPVAFGIVAGLIAYIAFDDLNDSNEEGGDR